MTAFTSWYPLIAPSCPGVADPSMDLALVLAAQEFCRRTGWYQDVQTLNVAAGVGEYEIDTPTGMELVAVKGVWFKSNMIKLVPAGEVMDAKALRGAVSGDSPEAGSPTAAYFKAPPDSAFYLYPLPESNAASAVTVRACYMPSMTAKSLPDELYAQWADAIASGAIFRLASTPNTPYFSPAAAQLHAARFEAALNRGSRESRLGRVQTSLAVRARPFA